MKNIVKNIVIFIIGGFIFEFLCTSTEYIILRYLKTNILFQQLFLNNFLKNFCIYVGILIFIFIIYLILNYFIINTLNEKLKVYKKERGNFYEKK